MFIFIFAIVDVIAGILLMIASPALQGNEFLFWIALTVLIKGFMMFVNEKIAKSNKYPWLSMFDFIAALALFAVNGGFLLPFYFVLGLIMAGKGVWQFIQSMVT